jgi:hypothetical protein
MRGESGGTGGCGFARVYGFAANPSVNPSAFNGVYTQK